MLELPFLFYIKESVLFSTVPSYEGFIVILTKNSEQRKSEVFGNS